MTRNKILLIIFAVLVIVIFGAVFYFFNNRDTNNESIPYVEETVAAERFVENNKDQLLGGTTNNFAVLSYGGEKDIKTLEQNGQEYALVRNPSIVGGLDLVSTDPFGTYYFAEDDKGERIVFGEGSPEGKHGYDEIGLVSGKLIRDRNTSTEYFVSYPESLVAQAIGLIPVPNTGASNIVLKSRYLLIKNLNSNVSVVAEIDNRGGEQGVLLVSDLVRKSLGLDNGSKSNLSVELVPAEIYQLGVVRF